MHNPKVGKSQVGMPASPDPDGNASGLVDGSFLATLLPVLSWAPGGAASTC